MAEIGEEACGDRGGLVRGEALVRLEQGALVEVADERAQGEHRGVVGAALGERPGGGLPELGPGEHGLGDE